MTLIKIVSGTYGYKVNNRICPKNAQSEPFEVEDTEAERLISVGVAEIAYTGVATPINNDESVSETNNEDNDKTSLNVKNEPVYENVHSREELQELTNSKLKEIAEDLGIDTAKLRTKKDFVSAIIDAEFELPPTLDVEEPIV